MRPARVIALVVAVFASFAPAGHADHIAIAPPFASGTGYQQCFSLPLSSCSAAAEADGETGGFAVEVDAVSPIDGNVPGVAEGYAVAVFRQTRQVQQQVSGVSMTITIHLDRAAIEVTTVPGHVAGVGRSYGELYATADVWFESCWCYGGAWTPIATSDGVIEDEEVVLTFEVRNGDGGPIRPGRAELWVEIGAYVSVNGYSFGPIPKAGHASAEIAGTVTSVTAHVV